MISCVEICKRYVLLPIAGKRNNSYGSLNNVAANCNYCSSTVNGAISRNFIFNTSNANLNDNNRANGNPVRCLEDYLYLGYSPFIKKRLL